jgi:hypothetical protein
VEVVVADINVMLKHVTEKSKNQLEDTSPSGGQLETTVLPVGSSKLQCYRWNLYHCVCVCGHLSPVHMLWGA